MELGGFVRRAVQALIFPSLPSLPGPAFVNNPIDTRIPRRLGNVIDLAVDEDPLTEPLAGPTALLHGAGADSNNAHMKDASPTDDGTCKREGD